MGTSVSAIIQVTTAAVGVPPSPVTGLVASGTTTTGTTLTWVAPATGTPPFTYQVQQNGANVGGTTQNLTETISGLTPGTLYTFQVLVTNSTGNNSSGTVSVTTLSVLPGAPTGLAVVGSPGSNNVNLAWTAPTVGTPPLTYQVSLRTPSGSGSFVAGPTSSTTSVSVTGLTSGATYDFEVAAINAAGTGPVSAVLANVQTTPTPVLPSAPQNPTTGTITATTVQVSWTAPSTGTTPFSYVLQWAPHGTTTFTSLSPTSSLTNTVSGLTASTSYDFQVFATNVAGTGPTSVVVSATTAAQNVVVPTAPTALTDTAVGTTTVNLQWTAPTTGTQPITYQPQWSPHGLNTFTNGPTVQTTQAQITGLTANTSYDFRVTASNSGGTSPTSTIFTVSTLPASTSVTFATPSTNVTLSTDKLTATSTGSSTPYASPGGVTSSTSQTAGKWAVQFTLSTITQNLAIGLCNSVYTTASGNLGGDTNGIGLYPSTGTGSQAALTVFYNSVLANGPPSPLSGDTNGALVTMLLNMDLTPPQVWFQTPAMIAAFGAGSYNNLSSANANPAGSPPTGGIPVNVAGALFFVFSAAEGGDVVVANGGTSPFSGTGVPSIFSPWGGGAPVVTIPGQITGLVAGSPTNSSVPLTWSVPSGTAPFSYNVMFRVHNVGSFLTFGTTNNVTSATVTGLTANTQYDFQVSASNAAGTGAASTTATATTTSAVGIPGAPVGVSTFDTTGTSISVSWQQPSTGSAPTSYQVQFRVTGTTAWSNAPAPVSSPDPTVLTTIGPTFTDNQGNVWSIGVSSTSGNGVFLNGAEDKTTSNVNLLEWTGHLITQRNTAGNFYQKHFSTDTWVQIPTPPTLPSTSGASEVITGLTTATGYDFQISATNGAGTGPFSTPVVSASTTGSGPVAGSFTISNAKIISPSGSIWVCRGVDNYFIDSNGSGNVADHASISKVFPGINTFKACLLQHHTWTDVLPFVTDWVTNNGCVIMIANYIYGAQDPINSGNFPADAATFASIALGAVKAGNPYVWIESCNEPTPLGGTSVEADHTNTYNAVRQLVNFTGTTTGTSTNLTISNVSSPSWNPGATIVPGMVINPIASSSAVPLHCSIVSQTSGTPGGAGVYVTSVATTVSNTSMSAGCGNIVVFCSPFGNPYFPNGEPSGVASTYFNMYNVIWDDHWYGTANGVPSTGPNDTLNAFGGDSWNNGHNTVSTRIAGFGAYTHSLDGTMPVGTFEWGDASQGANGPHDYSADNQQIASAKFVCNACVGNGVAGFAGMTAWEYGNYGTFGGDVLQNGGTLFLQSDHYGEIVAFCIANPNTVNTNNYGFVGGPS